MRSVAVLTTLLALAVCAPASAKLAPSARSAGDGWRVLVSVEPGRIGPIKVSVGPIRRAPETCSRCCAPAWLQHDLVVENAGRRPVTFRNLGIAARLGPARRPALLVAGGPCGYGNSTHQIELSCLMYLDIPTIKPRRSERRTVTLWKGLRGMSSLEPGTYASTQKLRFRVGRQPPQEGAGRSATFRIVYRVAAD